MRRSAATALTWADVELRDNVSDLLQVHRSKTDPEGEGVVIYIGRAAGGCRLRPGPKPKPRWDVHLPEVGDRAGSLAGGIRPLIAGLCGSDA